MTNNLRTACLLLVLSVACHVKGANSPAHEAAKHFMRGVNFGNFLETPPHQGWSIPHTTNDLATIRAEGFDHVRLPIGWHHYAGRAPEFKLSDAIFDRVDNLVTNATALGLALIINIHHFDALTSDPPANAAEFYAIWRQVALHYSNAPPTVAIELLNEPKDAATTAVMNPIYAEAIHQIRQSNPRRIIFVGPGKWNSVNELDHLQLPENDRNLIVTVHCYEPFFFTHQGAGWAGPDTKVTGIQFPGPPPKPLVPDPSLQLSPRVRDWIDRYNTLPVDSNPCSPHAFRVQIEKAKAWSEKNGRPIHFGEFGAFTKADPESRARFYASFRKALNEAGIGWAIWDWKSGFRYWNPNTHQPEPGMREALFPSK
jgi:endoglucanase